MVDDVVGGSSAVHFSNVENISFQRALTSSCVNRRGRTPPCALPPPPLPPTTPVEERELGEMSPPFERELGERMGEGVNMPTPPPPATVPFVSFPFRVGVSRGVGVAEWAGSAVVAEADEEVEVSRGVGVKLVRSLLTAAFSFFFN